MATERQARPGVPAASIVKLVAIALVVISLLWTASEQHYRACVAKAEAKFPAIPISALTGRTTGPLKVSFVEERSRAVDGCSHFF